MKRKLKAAPAFFKDNYFVLFAVLSMLFADLVLKPLVVPKVFIEAFVPFVSAAFTFGWVLFFVFVFWLVLPPKAGRIIYIITTSVFIILSLSQYIYFKIFGQFFWLKSIGLLGEGARYLGFALKHIDFWLILCIAFSTFSLVIAAKKWNAPNCKKRFGILLCLVPILMIFCLHTLMDPVRHGDSMDDWDSWRKPRVVYKNFNDANKCVDLSGLYQFTIRDFYSTFVAPDKYGKAEMEKVTEYFEKKPKTPKNEYTGILKGKNVIAVMLEGIDTWMIDQKHTPTLWRMMHEGLNFTNYHSPFFGTGHTFNAEFAFNTGLFTPKSAVSAVNFSANSYPYALPRLFKEAGYSVNSYHYNDSEFYNRGIMHRSFGYESYHSFAEFGMPETVSQSDSNILKNDAVYESMVSGSPFFSFVITYSGHVPYTFDDAKLALAKQNHPELVNKNMDSEKNNCLLLAADTDDFFAQLLERLEEDDLLKDTVIIAYTDHYAYGFSDEKKLKEYKNGDILYRVPAFMYGEGVPKKRVSKPMMTIDWLPTIVNLFGIETEGEYLGGDVLSPKTQGFVYFGNSAWLDEKMYYVPQEAEPKDSQKEHIQTQNARVKESFELNDIIVAGDYYASK